MEPNVANLLSPFIPDPSLSPHPSSSEGSPHLLHTLHQQGSSVLSLSADEHYIFSGSQSRDILVWDKRSFSLKCILPGHTGSVLALEYAPDKKWLFSSSGDSSVRIWSTVSLTPLYVLNPYLESGAGDLFSLAWSPSTQTIYIGCQNTSLQWFDFTHAEIAYLPGSSPSTPGGSVRKPHRFFDSYPQYQRRPADIYANNNTVTSPADFQGLAEQNSAPLPLPSFQIPVTSVIDSAHYGYVYCLALIDSTNQGQGDLLLLPYPSVQLVTGSGDETIKLWDCTPRGPNLLHTFDCGQGAVLSLVARGETVYAGCQDGHVKVWDLETRTLVRTIIIQEGVDILSLSMLHTDLYACSANGQTQRWLASFECVASWPAHDGHIILSSIITNLRHPDDLYFVTGGNDDSIKIWAVDPPKSRLVVTHFNRSEGRTSGNSKTDDTLVYALSKFVSIPSVSSHLPNREDCRQTAIWLKKCLTQLGAQSTLLPTGQGNNPLVFATFSGTKGRDPKPRILFYGHYDVIPAPPEGWLSDPFTLSGRNGYLYGRGVTDNKGPIIAVACAAAELLGKRALGLDLVFLIEGEEEVGSTGFAGAVKGHKDLIGHVDAILVSNSTWISEDQPCITYGLRGVVHCAIQICSANPDLHSGVEGGVNSEPMVDMVKLLAALVDDQRRVSIPAFYDSVRPVTEDETQLYDRLSALTQKPASSLSSRWREPSLTVHNIETSGPNNATIIPGMVKARVSVRIVPDQDLQTIAKSLCAHLKTTFKSFGSPNKLEVSIEHTADWWLGSLDDPWFRSLEAAVRDEWGVEPLRIREGGSIPSVPYLEKEFGCHALHLPLGQSSDQAHLPNERISLSNLRRGGAVIERFLLNVGGNGLHMSGKPS